MLPTGILDHLITILGLLCSMDGLQVTVIGHDDSCHKWKSGGVAQMCRKHKKYVDLAHTSIPDHCFIWHVQHA